MRVFVWINVDPCISNNLWFTVMFLVSIFIPSTLRSIRLVWLFCLKAYQPI